MRGPTFGVDGGRRRPHDGVGHLDEGRARSRRAASSGSSSQIDRPGRPPADVSGRGASEAGSSPAAGVHASCSPESVTAREPTSDGSHGGPAVRRFFAVTVLEVVAVGAVDALLGGAVVLDVPAPLVLVVDPEPAGAVPGPGRPLPGGEGVDDETAPDGAGVGVEGAQAASPATTKVRRLRAPEVRARRCMGRHRRFCRTEGAVRGRRRPTGGRSGGAEPVERRLPLPGARHRAPLPRRRPRPALVVERFERGADPRDLAGARPADGRPTRSGELDHARRLSSGSPAGARPGWRPRARRRAGSSSVGATPIHAAHFTGRADLVRAMERPDQPSGFLAFELGRLDEVRRAARRPRGRHAVRRGRRHRVHAASYGGQRGVAELLLAHGADAGATTRDTFLQIAPLAAAVATTPGVPQPSDDEDVVVALVRLLLEHDAPVDHRRLDGTTALHAAAWARPRTGVSGAPGRRCRPRAHRTRRAPHRSDARRHRAVARPPRARRRPRQRRSGRRRPLRLTSPTIRQTDGVTELDDAVRSAVAEFVGPPVRVVGRTARGESSSSFAIESRSARRSSSSPATGSTINRRCCGTRSA